MSSTETTTKGKATKSPPDKGSRNGSGPLSRDALHRRLDRIKGDGWADVLFVPTVLLALVLYLSFKNQYFATNPA